jgi:hypothetical protein
MGQAEELSAKYAARCLARVLLWSVSPGDDRVARAFGAFTRASVAARGNAASLTGAVVPAATMRAYRAEATALAFAHLWTSP